MTGFHHEALFYSGDDDYISTTMPFIEEGLGAGEPILVAVGAEKTSLLRRQLGAAADRVRFADMAVFGRNPARIIPVWRDFLDSSGDSGAAARGIGEPVTAERSVEELSECHRHEALLNLAFVDANRFRLLCPYDTGSLEPEVIEAAHRTHPYVSEQRRSRRSSSYRGPRLDRGSSEMPLAQAPDNATRIEFDRDRLGELRRLVAGFASGAGADPERASDLVLASSELAANSVRHAGGEGTLAIWREQDQLLCEVSDEGSISDPMIGRTRPDLVPTTGRGLWLVNQICDLVQMRSGPHGSVVRIRVSMH